MNITRIIANRIVLLTSALLVSSVSWATPITGTACTEPTAAAYTTYVNCGTFIEKRAGNDGGGPLTILGESYSQIAKWDADSGDWDDDAGDPGANWSVTGTPGDNGTWESAFDILFMVIKAADHDTKNGTGGFSIYGQGGISSGTLAEGDAAFFGASEGFWATAPTLISGETGRNVSHISFYGRSVSVPEPGTIILLGLGLAGLGVSRRRQS